MDNNNLEEKLNPTWTDELSQRLSDLSDSASEIGEAIMDAVTDPQKIQNRKWAIHRFNEVLLAMFFIGFAQAIGHPEMLRIILDAMVATEVAVFSINLRNSYLIPAIAPRGDRPHDILVNDTRAQTAFSFIFTLGVAAVVILGGEFGMTAIESLGPVIFTALCTTGVAFRLGSRAYYQNQLAKVSIAEFVDNNEKNDQIEIYTNLISQNTTGAALSAVLGAGVVGSLLEYFPYSSPYYGLAAGGIIGSYSAISVAVPLIQRCFPKKAEQNTIEIEQDLEVGLDNQHSNDRVCDNTDEKKSTFSDSSTDTVVVNPLQKQTQEVTLEQAVKKQDIETASVTSEHSSNASWQNNSGNAVSMRNVVSNTLHGNTSKKARKDNDKVSQKENRSSCVIM